MRGLAIAVLILGGCASRAPQPAPPETTVPLAPRTIEAPRPPKQALPHYRCDNNVEFDVRFADGSAELRFAWREPETVLRDAGGVTPEQTVYSSTTVKAQFGLEPEGRGAKLNFTAPPLEVRCTRD